MTFRSPEMLDTLASSWILHCGYNSLPPKSEDAAKVLVTSCTLSGLDPRNALLAGCHEDIHPLQRVQYPAACLIFGGHRRQSSSPFMTRQLNVSEHIKYKIGCIC